MAMLDSSIFDKKKTAVLILATISYSLLFMRTFPSIAHMAGIFLIIPVLLVGFLYGARTSILYTIFILAWQTFLLGPWVGILPIERLTDWGFMALGITLFFLAVLVGHLHDLRTQLQQQLNAQEQSENEVKTLNDTLETRIDQQTEELRESNARWQFALEGSGDGVWDWDMHTGEVFYNPQWRKMLGFEGEELENTYEAWKHLVHPQDFPPVRAKIDAYLQGETAVFTAEYRIKHKAGNYIWVLARGKLVHDKTKTNVHMIGTHTDITHRKLNEDAIYNIAKGVSAATGEQFFTALVQYIGEKLQADTAFIGKLNHQQESPAIQTIAVYENQQTAPNFEYSLEHTPCATVVGKSLCIYKQNVAQTFPEDIALLNNGIEGYIGAPLFSSEGEAIGIIVVLYKQPIPNSSIAQSIIQIFAARAAAELERTQTELALRDSKEQLHQAQKMEAVGRLAGGIAHDFNNILTVIISYSDLLLHKLPPQDNTYKHAQQIKDAGEKAAALTHQLLAFSRRQVLEPKILDLNEVIRNLTGMLRRLIENNIILVFDLDDSIHPIKTDMNQLELVIMNLLINAKDAMPDGGEIKITTQQVELQDETRKNSEGEFISSGSYIKLTVSDTGSGIDPDVLSHMFEPFFTTKERNKGTGLGLAMVHGFMKQSNGHILVESDIGSGTTFTLFFPDAPNEASQKETDPIKGHTSTTSGTETVLLVEDEVEVRNIARDILQLFGYNVVISDAVDAVDVCRQHNGRIHLLLTDIMMPKMNGRQLVEKMNTLCPNLKILYMSGYTNDPHLEDAFIAKPFTPQALVQKVRAVLDA